MKSIYNLKKYAGLFICTLFILTSCSKDDSIDTSEERLIEGEIYVTGDVAVEGKKKIKKSVFRYSDGWMSPQISISGESDGTAISGFNMLFSGIFMEKDKLLKVGTYKYTRGEDPSPYFDSFYEDTYDTGDGDYSYMSFHAYDGELKIVESTEEVIRGEFTLKGLYDLTDNKVDVKGKFKATKAD